MSAPFDVYHEIETDVSPPDEQGIVTARIITLAQANLHGVRYQSGGLQPGPLYMSVWNHNSARGARFAPAGVGEAVERDGYIEATAKLLLDTESGRAAHALLSASMPEWSAGVRIMEGEYASDADVFDARRYRVFEMSPVDMGADVDTATIALQSALTDGRLGLMDEMLRRRYAVARRRHTIRIGR